VRLRIVVRSLGVILVSPWVALLIGQAQTPSVVAPAAEAAPAPITRAHSQSSLPDHVSAFAKLGVTPAAAAEAVSPPPQAQPAVVAAQGIAPPAVVAAQGIAPPAVVAAQGIAPPHEISVACGKDGCVVQNGLEVMVVAGKPAR
jgi:hypothetical protein